MYRKSVNKRRSAKSFRSAVGKTDRKNLINRGGYRL
jgi:hypothetical protein